ncbi:MAG: tetratricopeptide repeat protein [Planctomycetota bacterium]
MTEAPPPPPSAERTPAEILKAIPQPTDARPAAQLLGDVTVERRLLEDFRPFPECLEARLSREYWRTQGLRPFVEGAVPYLIHNNGWAAESAAEVLFARCTEGAAPELIGVLELGAGLGLHARHFLDHFRSLSRKAGLDLYERLRYYVTDLSRQTIASWHDRRLFAEHEAHVVLAECDASHPGTLKTAHGDSIELPKLHAIHANYLLDSLPTTVIRPSKSESAAEQLCVRTYIANEVPATVWRSVGLRLEEVIQEVASARPDGLARLLPLLPYLEFEVAFLPIGLDGRRYVSEILASPLSDRRVLNFGALDCVAACLDLLAPQGYILVNDFGPAVPETVGDLSYVSRFGRSIAASLNFPFLEEFIRELGGIVVQPQIAQPRSVQSRLIGRSLGEQTTSTFRRVYENASAFEADRLGTEAIQHIHAGRLGLALDCFRESLELCPQDWNLLGQAAQFLTQQLHRPSEALELARRALALNPWYSSFLWNTFGNCLFFQGAQPVAHGAYERALALNPTDAQTWLNLAYSLAERGDHGQALTAIARGLEHDHDGRFDEALLNKQRQVLAAIDAERAALRGRENRRHELFSHAR